MKLIEAPYGERMDRGEVMDLMDELRYRANSLLSPCDTYDETDESGACANHAELVFHGTEWHAFEIEGSVPELVDRLERCLDRLGVATN